jgi:hypothetical protein
MGRQTSCLEKTLDPKRPSSTTDTPSLRCLACWRGSRFFAVRRSTLAPKGELRALGCSNARRLFWDSVPISTRPVHPYLPADLDVESLRRMCAFSLRNRECFVDEFGSSLVLVSSDRWRQLTVDQSHSALPART